MTANKRIRRLCASCQRNCDQPQAMHIVYCNDYIPKNIDERKKNKQNGGSEQ